jgi:hypothetical protein
MEDPASYGLPGVKNQPKGDRKGGVVWHNPTNTIKWRIKSSRVALSSIPLINVSNWLTRCDASSLPSTVFQAMKRLADENASVKSAYKQLQTYKATIPSLFTHNGLMIISDGLEAKAGSLSAGLIQQGGFI